MNENPSSMKIMSQSNTVNDNKKRVGFSYKSWFIWFICFVISLLPVIVISFLGDIININIENAEQITTLTKQTASSFGMWFNIDIFYICASMGASAIIELISNKDEKPKLLFIVVLTILIIVIMMSLFLYGALYVSVNIYQNQIKSGIISYNQVFLGGTFVVGSLAFIKFKEF